MRSKKALKNIIVSMLYQIVSIICGLITPRLILGAFGSTYNGVVSSATQFLSVISLLTVGISGATRLALYKTLAHNDTNATSEVMKANRLYMRKVAICLLAYSILLSIIYPFISKNDLTRIESGTIVLIVSLGTFADYFFGISNRTLLAADQSGYIDSAVNIIKTIINTCLTAILIKLGYSIFVVKLGSSIVFFLSPLILSIYINKKYRLINDCKPNYRALEQRKAVAFHSIANIIHNNTDLVILTVFADAKVISVYTVYYLVVGKVKTIMTVFTNGLESAFGNMWAKRETDALNRNFNLMEYSLFSFTSVIFSCMGILILPFIKIYTKGITDTNYMLTDLAILITITEAIFCVRQPYVILVQATGNYEATKNGAILEAVINLVMSLCLVPMLGINGVIIGTMAANIIRTTQFAIFIYSKILNKNIINVVFRFVWMGFNWLVTIIVHRIIIGFFLLMPNWIDWVKEALLTFLLALSVCIVNSLIFYHRDLLGIVSIMKRIIGHKKK